MRTDDLRADCARCVGLCCVVPAFAASSDFAIDKPAGQPCPNLRPDSRCSIHRDLRERGFPGCAVYDCFGAGQQVVQVTFGGTDLRRTPRMAAAFTVMRQLHELLWYLTEAVTLPPAVELHGELDRAAEEIRRLTRGGPDDLAELAVADHWRAVDALLLRTSELVRAQVPGGPDHRRADLIGHDLAGADLTGANLRGAYLIGADLRGADLDMADLIGADLRGADVRGARLAGSIFLTQFQINAAKGDAGTTLPSGLTRPAHFASAG